jgi:hypothetical protein
MPLNEADTKTTKKHLINTIYNPKKEKEIIIGLKCSGLDFKNKEKWSEDGLTPEIIDEKSYLKYDGEIEVTGKATIEGREFKASDLDLISDEIKLNINYEIDDITVKTFHGKYDGKIDGSVETIDLDLGDVGEGFKKTERCDCDKDQQHQCGNTGNCQY